MPLGASLQPPLSLSSCLNKQLEHNTHAITRAVLSLVPQQLNMTPPAAAGALAPAADIAANAAPAATDRRDRQTDGRTPYDTIRDAILTCAQKLT